MLISAAVIILSVKLGLLRAIDSIANALNWSAKARGQATGYATSVPELVCLVSAGLAGVWEAGLWNIASSNIINSILMLLAVLSYRQFGDLLNLRFLDEILFASTAIAIPLVLMHFKVDTEWYLVPALLGFFILFRMLDRKMNRSAVKERPARKSVGNLPYGIILGLSALIAITIAGVFLGNATADVVEQLGIKPALAGWILGFTTSIPEMVTFFAIYATARREGTLLSLDDTQESLDNLTGSNVSNVGVVYPLGLLAFICASLLWVD